MYLFVRTENRKVKPCSTSATIDIKLSSTAVKETNAAFGELMKPAV
jgi:hypothetical protein